MIVRHAATMAPRGKFIGLNSSISGEKKAERTRHPA